VSDCGEDDEDEDARSEHHPDADGSVRMRDSTGHVHFMDDEMVMAEEAPELEGPRSKARKTELGQSSKADRKGGRWEEGGGLPDTKSSSSDVYFALTSDFWIWALRCLSLFGFHCLEAFISNTVIQLSLLLGQRNTLDCISLHPPLSSFIHLVCEQEAEQVDSAHDATAMRGHLCII
jgi:hypothetical protein